LIPTNISYIIICKDENSKNKEGIKQKKKKLAKIYYPCLFNFGSSQASTLGSNGKFLAKNKKWKFIYAVVETFSAY
jgi:hypothetical protein